jgi:putative membrane protein
MIEALVPFAASTQDHWAGPGWWWPVFPLLWLLLVVVIVARFSFLGRRRWREHGTQAGEARLAERYAAGEIDEQEYERRLATLRRLGR